jgi:hypothetical protein
MGISVMEAPRRACRGSSGHAPAPAPASSFDDTFSGALLWSGSERASCSSTLLPPPLVPGLVTMKRGQVEEGDHRGDGVLLTAVDELSSVLDLSWSTVL